MAFPSIPVIPILFCLTFLVLGLLINLIQIVLYFTIPKTLFTRLNYYLVYGLHGYLLSIGDWWCGNVVNIHCSKEMQRKIQTKDVQEHALFLMNHHTELDWLYSWMMADRLSILGNCRAFAKDSLKYIPIIGWSWAMSDMVFLKREWDNDQETMRKTLNNLLQFPSPVWLLLFPEGTRFTPDKHKASLQFATKSGLPHLKHHLTPRTKGFSYIMNIVDRKKLRAIYDITLVVGEDSAPFDITSIIKGKSTIGNVYIRRIPVDTISKDMGESAAWLHNLFKEKDDLKHRFITTGNFTDDCSFVTPVRRIPTLFLLIISNILVLIPLLYSMLVGGFILRLMVLLLAGLSLAAMKMIGDSTKIDKSSKYGGINNNKYK